MHRILTNSPRKCIEKLLRLLRKTLLLAALTTLLSGFATAGECPTEFPETPPRREADQKKSLAQLDEIRDSCLWRADFLAYRGVLLLLLDRPDDAVVDLERSLMLDPERVGTQLDFAQALAQINQQKVARELAKQVAARPDLPGPLQAMLAGVLGEVEQGDWQSKFSVQWLMGYETNLNGAPRLRSLTLTLPNGQIPLEIDKTVQPQSGPSALLGLSGALARKIGAGELGSYLNYRGRATEETNQTGYQQLDAAVIYALPLRGDRPKLDFTAPTVIGKVDISGLRFGGSHVYRSGGALLGLEFPGVLGSAILRPMLAADYANRHYPVATELDGVYIGAALSLNIEQAGQLFQMVLRTGNEDARDPRRAGGDQAANSFALRYLRKFSWGEIDLGAALERTRDEQPYSPLINDGESRNMTRKSYRVGVNFFLQNQLSLLTYFEYFLQDSNIALFNISNRTLHLGVKWDIK